MQNKSSKQSLANDQRHQPVLLDMVLNYLDPKAGETYLDLTAGYGGHAAAVAERMGKRGQLILVDRDQEAVNALRKKFSSKATIVHDSYQAAIAGFKEASADMILLDLGVSSPQLDNPERGFSFRAEAPLDMRMDQRQEFVAADIVNSYPQSDIADILYYCGEETRSRQIAQAIVQNRPLKTTTQLADLVATVVPRRGRIHPATKTFQGLRIAVNNELAQLENALPVLVKLLRPNGRLAVISFHSLEDRIVKQFLKQQPELAILTKKAVQGKFIDASNPRARSAKLRAAIKIQRVEK